MTGKVKKLLLAGTLLTFAMQQAAGSVDRRGDKNNLAPANIELYIANRNDANHLRSTSAAEEEANRVLPSNLSKKDEGGWCQQMKDCFLFWRKPEYYNSYTALHYQGGCCRQLTHCFNDALSIFIPCKTIDNLTLKATDNKRITANKLKRIPLRRNFYPLVTRTFVLSLSIFIYGFFNILRDDRAKFDEILGGNFKFCSNPFLNDLVKEVPSVDNETTMDYDIRNISALLDGIASLFDYNIDNLQIDFTLLPEVPSSTFLTLLAQQVDAYRISINDTHHSGYTVYDPYWPNPVTDEIRTSVSTNFTSTSSFNITTSETSSFASDTSVSTYYGTKSLCFKRHEFPKAARAAAWLANKKEACFTYTFPVVDTFINNQITIQNVTNVTNVENNFYETLITSTFESIGITVPSLSTANITIGDIQRIADQISDEAVERFRNIIIEILVRIKFASDLYPIIPCIMPWFSPGYVVAKMGLRLRVYTCICNITKLKWILLVVAILYIVEILPFGFPDIWRMIRFPNLIINYMINLTTDICHLQSEKEVATAYAIGEIVKQQQNIKQQIETSLSFVSNDQSIENTYQNFSELVYQNIYGPLDNETSYYQELLDGTRFINEIFTYFPGKEVCDPSLLSTTHSPSISPTFTPTLSPVVGVNITNLTSNIVGSVGVNRCGTIFDVDYVDIVLNKIHEDYRIDIGNAWLPLLLYPISPIIVVGFIKSIASLFCPLARYRGRMIGTKALLKDDAYDVIVKHHPPKYTRVANHIRLTNMIPFGIACFFLTIAAINNAL